ncbi:MAG: hypothetical protein JNM36_14720, partial [Chitinophagales bacterium]|nr:hypothetical protein [Chitinophagales bacterium]
EDVLGINIDMARYRTLDPQIARWWQIDPEVNSSMPGHPIIVTWIIRLGIRIEMENFLGGYLLLLLLLLVVEWIMVFKLRRMFSMEKKHLSV